MKLYHLGWNQTHRGHHLKADACIKDLKADQLRAQIYDLIDRRSRTCRIWVNNRCVWYYDDASCFSLPTATIIDNIMKDLP